MTAAQGKAIADADNWALSKEAYVLLPSKGLTWWCAGLYDPEDLDQNCTELSISTFPQKFHVIREAWKRRHRQLARRVGI
jgi:hypothetical protein